MSNTPPKSLDRLRMCIILARESSQDPCHRDRLLRDFGHEKPDRGATGLISREVQMNVPDFRLGLIGFFVCKLDIETRPPFLLQDPQDVESALQRQERFNQHPLIGRVCRSTENGCSTDFVCHWEIDGDPTVFSSIIMIYLCRHHSPHNAQLL